MPATPIGTEANSSDAPSVAPARGGEIGSAAASLAVATMVSRLLGYVRLMTISALFGAGLATDAFFIAFRIPALLREFTAENAVAAAYVPVFSSLKTRKGLDKAFDLTRSTITVSILVLSAALIVAEFYAPTIVKMIAPGFGSDPAKFDLTVTLTRLMLPFALLVAIAAVLTGTLNAIGVFFYPAIATSLFNVGIIGSAFFLYSAFAEPTIALAVGVLIGGAAHMAIQLHPLARVGFHYRARFRWRADGLGELARLLAPVSVGALIYQVNAFVGSILASLLEGGAVSYLAFSLQVSLLPFGLFGVSIAQAALPSMSSEYLRAGKARLRELTSSAITMVSYLTIPASIGLIALAGPIVNILFQRGLFSATDRIETASALSFYAIGGVAFSVLKSTQSAFYAMKDSFTPMKVAAFGAALNLFLAVGLMGSMLHNGIALALSIATIAQAVYCAWLLRVRLGALDGWKIFASLTRAFLAAIVMGVAVYFYAERFFDYADPLFERVFHLCVAIALGVILYYGCSILFGSSEPRALSSSLKTRLSAKS